MRVEAKSEMTETKKTLANDEQSAGRVDKIWNHIRIAKDWFSKFELLNFTIGFNSIGILSCGLLSDLTRFSSSSIQISSRLFLCVFI